MTSDQFNEIISNEGDYYEFYHCDFFCNMKRHRDLKHWCGYITLTKDSKLHMCYNNSNTSSIPVCIHGGWTYNNIEGDNYIIGFDCAHAGDFNSMDFLWSKKSRKKDLIDIPSRERNIYRNKQFVISELKNACEQLQEYSISKIRTKKIADIL